MALHADEVKSEAHRLGFIACGISHLGPTPHADFLDSWLAQGRGGNMRYLHRQAKKRKNPAIIERGARVAVVVLDNYYSTDSASPPSHPPSPGQPKPRVARYARGQDYHRVTLRRLGSLADFLRYNGAKVARPFVDSGPVPERELAQRAGLGWIGKNTMLIRPAVGSFFFIGSVLTELQITCDRPFETDHCGSCTRCLDACPRGALTEPRALDANRCISYLTIEHRGPIPDPLTPHLAGWAFGCDICNEVCPWNISFAEISAVPEFAPRHDFDDAGPRLFEEMDEGEFADRFGDTPLERGGLLRMRRNWRAAWNRLAPG